VPSRRSSHARWKTSTGRWLSPEFIPTET
jgi:hypothetical protein